VHRSDAEEDEPLPPPTADDEAPPLAAPLRGAGVRGGRGAEPVGAAHSLDALYGELWEDKVQLGLHRNKETKP